MAPGAERKWKLSLGGFAAKVKATHNQGLGGSDKGRLGVGDFQTLDFEFLNKMRYNICNTFLGNLDDTS